MIASERDNDDDYDNVYDEHDSNKRLCPSILMGGRNGCKEWSLLSGLHIYRQRIFPPQPQTVRGPGEASGSSHLSASVANFQLMLETSSRVGGLAWARARARSLHD